MKEYHTFCVVSYYIRTDIEQTSLRSCTRFFEGIINKYRYNRIKKKIEKENVPLRQRPFIHIGINVPRTNTLELEESNTLELYIGNISSSYV